MSSDTANAKIDTNEDAYARIAALEAHVSADSTRVGERLDVLKTKVEEYDRVNIETDKRDAWERIESELDRIRDAIEEEVDQGERRAHELVDDIEASLSTRESRFFTD